MNERTRTRLYVVGGLFAFTLLAFIIHGYHYGIEDEAIYLPAIKKIIDPTLYPRGSEFFMGQARGTALPWIIAGFVRVTHASLPWTVLAAQFVSIYTFLLGCWMIARRCFPAARQQWAGVAMVTALLTLPIAGTSIYLADQHLHPRTLACALLLIAIAFALDRRARACTLACIGAVLIHPLMALYGIGFVVVLWIPLERWTTIAGVFVAIPFVARPTAAWREALATRPYYSLRNWEWYEWLGLLAPLVIVWLLARVAERQQLSTMAKLLRRLNVYSVIMLAVTLVMSLPRATDFLSPLQPFRYLHTVYVLMIITAAGLLVRKRVWPVAAAAVVLAGVMCAVQFVEFPPDIAHHIDWPGLRPLNGYVQAFLWVRDHTSKDAYFALNPSYMRDSANYGFRALAERSQMADISKDAGVVTVSPQLAAEWKREVDALRGDDSTASTFAYLRREFGVDWVIMPWNKHVLNAFDCPFQSSAPPAGALVCRTPSAPLALSGASN